MSVEKRLHEITVRVIVDPGGDPAVLLQLPNGWITMSAQGARNLAKQLTLTAEDLDAGTFQTHPGPQDT